MSQLSVSDWKTFLNARIQQEQGRDEDALRVFSKLLEKYPTNPHLLASRSFGLARTGRSEEARAAQVASRYADLGRTLVGDDDQPDQWTRHLKGLLQELDGAEVGAVSTTLVAW